MNKNRPRPADPLPWNASVSNLVSCLGTASDPGKRYGKLNQDRVCTFQNSFEEVICAVPLASSLLSSFGDCQFF